MIWFVAYILFEYILCFVLDYIISFVYDKTLYTVHCSNAGPKVGINSQK